MSAGRVPSGSRVKLMISSAVCRSRAFNRCVTLLGDPPAKISEGDVSALERRSPEQLPIVAAICVVLYIYVRPWRRSPDGDVGQVITIYLREKRIAGNVTFGLLGQAKGRQKLIFLYEPGNFGDRLFTGPTDFGIVAQSPDHRSRHHYEDQRSRDNEGRVCARSARPARWLLGPKPAAATTA